MPTCIIGKVRIGFAKENLSHRRQTKIPASLSSLIKDFAATVCLVDDTILPFDVLFWDVQAIV